MAFTSSDLDTLDRAIATGEMTVRTVTGQMVTYRSMDELIKARQVVAGELAATAAAATGTQRAYPRHQLSDFGEG